MRKEAAEKKRKVENEDGSGGTFRFQLPLNFIEEEERCYQTKGLAETVKE